ncbi:glycosyltransferase family 2 protein [Hymenobacter sp. UV11]|uniref:glycosyltransferase n=1 Tax=Hymenobacter sp. UV11 TaxID=1849735 RepID=UPI00105D2E3A|nr:glycosyltransferase [Hymenobacter sp. UV11]TFZ67418.1 glycosyltransferase family 2 protein [Hymenobacter sp. UV11]
MERVLHQRGISVLICTYNGIGRLKPTLAHLARQVVASTIPWEVIVVDNNSSDGTLTYCKAEWNLLGKPVPLYLLSQPIPGKQFALEMAYDAANYEFMCIVDDDNWLQVDYLQRGYDILCVNPAIGLVGGRNVGAFEIKMPAWFPAFQASYAVGKPIVYSAESNDKVASGEVLNGTLWGAGLFVRHAIWRELRALKFKSLFTGRQGDKQLVAGEDDELCFLTRLLGYKIWYSDDLQLTHYMTAGRLNENYLLRLCYASSRAYPTMSVYQRMMAPDWLKYRTLTPWLKDWFYISFKSIQAAVSSDYIKSFFRLDLASRLRVNGQLLTWYYFTKQFAVCRRNFENVAFFQKRIEQFQALVENNPLYSLSTIRPDEIEPTN